MHFRFQCPATSTTPAIDLWPAAGRFSLRGPCDPADPALFFTPLLNALRRVMHHNRPATIVVDFSLTRVNAGSSKYLLLLLRALDKAYDNSYACDMNWHVQPEDDALLKLGYELAEELRLPLTVLPDGHLWRRAG